MIAELDSREGSRRRDECRVCARAIGLCPTVQLLLEDAAQSCRRKSLDHDTGAWFRRQAIIGERFIVDFVASAARLVVEVDGPYHTRRRSADARRDRKLARLDYRVLRLEAALVLEHPEQAVACIRAALAEQA